MTTNSPPGSGETTTTIVLRERETPEGTLVSVCDADCLGETYDNDQAKLEVDPEFYAGDDAEEVDSETDSEAVVERLHSAQVANIVGTVSVGVAIDAGLIDEETVLEFEETRHAQLLWL